MPRSLEDEEANTDVGVKTKIKGGIARKKERAQKTVKSNFLLTISTNQRYKDNDPSWESDSQAFEDTLLEILNDLPTYINVLNEGHSWSSEWIKDAQCDYVIEHGPSTGALHCHVLFKLKHHTKVQLNYDRIKDKIKGDLGLENVYLQNKLVRPSSDDFLTEYLEKYR
jgi:hypothetical protein